MTNAEQKRNRWLKCAPDRVNRLAHDYQLLSNMLNKSNYTYTEAEKAEILRAVEQYHKDFLKAWKKPSRKPFKFEPLTED